MAGARSWQAGRIRLVCAYGEISKTTKFIEAGWELLAAYAPVYTAYKNI